MPTLVRARHASGGPSGQACTLPQRANHGWRKESRVAGGGNEERADRHSSCTMTPPRTSGLTWTDRVAGTGRILAGPRQAMAVACNNPAVDGRFMWILNQRTCCDSATSV